MSTRLEWWSTSNTNVSAKPMENCTPFCTGVPVQNVSVAIRVVSVSWYFCHAYRYKLIFLLTGTLLDPQNFVRHLHSERENQTCHWGFDASHWRSYVHISDIYHKKSASGDASDPDLRSAAGSPASSTEGCHMSPDKAQNLLDEVKKRFNHPKLARKQVSTASTCLILVLYEVLLKVGGGRPSIENCMKIYNVATKVHKRAVGKLHLWKKLNNIELVMFL